MGMCLVPGEELGLVLLGQSLLSVEERGKLV